MGDNWREPAPMPSSLPDSFREEKASQKILRKLYQEPLIPLGCVLTCYALFQANKSIRAGDHHRTQRFFRMRIYGQAFTILAMVAGSYYYAEERTKRKEFEGAVADRRAKEKQEAWIKELEHRQQEEQELAEQRAALLRAREEALKQHQSKGVKSALEASERSSLGIADAVRALRPRW